ncbi:MAG: NINE protein [Lewinellaceae bacterium]|nr:NINE protein [Saprospiraceae bacterium]MCB9337404.1 NINE protein [Lewinellaceae bacterium]
MKQIKRRLAAIMFTDIVGYTAMMQQDEVIATRMRNRHREIFARFTEKYEGEILQYYGDGTLSIYPSSSAAVQCALEIQRELKKEPPVSIRVGIHTGEISYGEEDVYGDGVNIASRIESRCVPGGVFISEKVYDDIKNNANFKLRPLGSHALKNVVQPIKIFALANEGLNLPEQMGVAKREEPAALPTPARAVVSGRKKKHVAGLLAIFFGMFGTHRFYLGQRKMGLAYLIATMAVLFVIPGLSRFIPVMAITAFIDGILLWTMPRGEFDAKFNTQMQAGQQQMVPSSQAEVQEAEHKSLLKTQFEKYKEQALAEYRDLDYESAIGWFKKAAELKNHDPEIHYMLACCYSLMENTDYAILHLDAAVAFGLKDQIRIISSGDLAFLRTQPIFEVFSKNGYRLPKEMPPPSSDLLQTKSHRDEDLLAQLNKLQALKTKGVITEEEYQRLKPGQDGTS